ncbi:hypothetical protein EDF36_3015 [Rathayibacter sp. PhB152]|nr:hypothetical protein EDF36_3015 [Rathayibacter sp. PhB152]
MDPPPARGSGRFRRAGPVSACRTSPERTSGSPNHPRLVVPVGSGVQGLFPRAGRLRSGPPARGFTSGSWFRSVPVCRALFRVSDVPGSGLRLVDSPPARGSGRFRRAGPVSACRTSPERASGSWIHLRLVVSVGSGMPGLFPRAGRPRIGPPARGLPPARGFGRFRRAGPVSACRTPPDRTSGSWIHLRLVVPVRPGVPGPFSRAGRPRIGPPARGTTPGSSNPPVPACRSRFRVPGAPRRTRRTPAQAPPQHDPSRMRPPVDSCVGSPRPEPLTRE